MEQFVPYNSDLEPADYVDNLLPGYRFCPTDSELIVYYLKPKIEKRQHPACRLYEVNLYDHNPHELSEWVLCKIYKKETNNQANSSSQLEQVRNQDEGGNEEPNLPQDEEEPSHRRRRLSGTNEPANQHVHIQEVNHHHLDDQHVQLEEANHRHYPGSTMVANIGQFILNVNQHQPVEHHDNINANQQQSVDHYERGRPLITPMGSDCDQILPLGQNPPRSTISMQPFMFQGSTSIQPTEAPHQGVQYSSSSSISRNSTRADQSMSTATDNSFLFSDGTSNFQLRSNDDDCPDLDLMEREWISFDDLLSPPLF